jgi:uncharacterized protein GlcG (DUF336 family)
MGHAKSIGINSCIPPDLGSSFDPEFISFGERIPIRRHNVVIGEIGVGGADRGNSDTPNEACAQAGPDAIKS